MATGYRPKDVGDHHNHLPTFAAHSPLQECPGSQPKLDYRTRAFAQPIDAQSEELYLLVYPLNPTGSTTLGQLTLPSGYQPNCDPCFHPGIPLQFAYHDHVLTGAPGLGKDGTAGVFKSPWKIILLIYNPAVAFSPTFTPVTSANDIDAAEAAGTFLQINPGSENPFEIETGNVLICPLVAPDA